MNVSILESYNRFQTLRDDSWDRLSLESVATLNYLTDCPLLCNLNVLVIPGLQRDKTMADKMMYIPNDCKQNIALQLVVAMFRHSS